MSNDLRICSLDGRQRTKQAVLSRLARSFDFPKHFGKNLDALNDALAVDCQGPLRIDWRLTENAAASLGGDLQRIIDTLEKIAQERADVEFHLFHPAD